MSNLSHRLNSSLSDASFKLSCEIVQSKLVPIEQSVIDRILTFKKADQPEIITDDGKKYVWYLAIGSMINPISLFLREIQPLMSYPVIAQDHHLVFRGPGGMGDIDPCSGATFHGVIHLLTEENMLALDKVEMVYRRVPVTCIDYQNQTQIASAYKMTITNLQNGIPSERYLDVIVKGCEHYKVQQEYIDHLRNNQPVIPRRKPSELRSFTNIPENVFFTEEELKKHDSKDSSLPIWMAINGKVLEYAGLPDKDQPGYQQQKRMYGFVCDRLAGRETTLGTARGLYDPLYKLPLNDEDISDEHRAQVEDNIYGLLNSEGNQNHWKVIGRLQK